MSLKPPQSVVDVPQMYILFRNQGEKLTGWTGLQVNRAIDACADTFSFSVPFDPTPENLERFKPYIGGGPAGNKVEIFGENERFATGYVEVVSCISDGNQRVINLQGRSTTGVLMDWSAGSLYSATAPHFPRTAFEFQNMTFNQIAKVIAFPNSVYAVPDTGVMADVAIEPGQTIYNFISKLAAANGLYGRATPEGALQYSKLGNTPPVVDLEEGRAPVETVESNHDITKRFFKYQILANTTGQPGVQASAYDLGVNAGQRGSKIIEPKQQSADYQQAANFARSRGFIDSYTVTATCTGFVYQDYSGTWKFWEAGDVVRLYAPGAFVRKLSRFIIQRVTFQMDTKQGQRTKLDLTLPELYNGETPQEKPWEG